MPIGQGQDGRAIQTCRYGQEHRREGTFNNAYPNCRLQSLKSSNKAKNKETETLKAENAALKEILEIKEKEFEKLLNGLSKERKTNNNLMAKVNVDTQLQDYHFVKGELFRLKTENNELKSEVKGLKCKLD